MIHIITHPKCLEHNMGPGHPESPERLETIMAMLETPEWEAMVEWHEAPLARIGQLERVHTPVYIELVRSSSEAGGRQLDPDTATNGASWEAALRAAGAAVQAGELALDQRENTFALVRPPGHHALAGRAMGFCLFSNVVIAVREILERPDTQQILIVDWDVHHGNGTQALVEEEPRIRFVSLHQWPHYPGTGSEDERGVGNIWNVPRPPGLSPDRYRDDLLDAIGEATAGWRPDLVFISAGFDSMAGDPLAGFTLREEDYIAITEHLRSLGAPLVGVLEGGYNLENLRVGTAAFLKAIS
ncbi:histone deacetylase family protein [Candidatus Zixiibacteriota bacterium]